MLQNKRIKYDVQSNNTQSSAQMISKMEKTINGHNQGMIELESESAMQKGLEGKIGKQRSKEEDGDD